MRYTIPVAVALLACFTSAQLAHAEDAPELTPQAAKALFDQAGQQCQADAGKLWSKSLCGPIMFVEPKTRWVVASQADAEGQLKPRDGVFVGTLPPDQTIANTSVEWAGVRWVQMQWPMPGSEVEQRVLIAHESFHRLQPEIGLAGKGEAANAHLDTLQGRYLMQLEWRALEAALKASNDGARKTAARDALLFRRARDAKFPEAHGAETALERNEGLAEYTGVTLGSRSPAERTELALKDITFHVADPSFVRSFAYATGPSYGILLDTYAPQWRTAIRANAALAPADLLAKALGVGKQTPTDAQVTARAKAYDGAALLASETVRAEERAKREAVYRKALVDGPVLILPLPTPKIMFDPRTLFAMGDTGTVYPTAKVLDVWGSLDVRQDMLLAKDWSHVVVALGDAHEGQTGNVRMQGWTLQLGEGWTLVPGDRPGDLTVKQSDPPTH